MPIVVGGTGQYVWALNEGWEIPKIPPDAAYRSQLESEAAEQGGHVLHQRLQQIDPQRASQLDPRNLRRVIRALEIYHTTGTKPSVIATASGKGRPGTVLGLTMPRERLYSRIDRRVDQMMADGFLDEAASLAERGFALGQGPLACPGYKELGQHLAGELSLEEAVQRTKFQTHRLARRQYTWFKPTDSRIAWLDGEDPGSLQAALRLVKAKS